MAIAAVTDLAVRLPSPTTEGGNPQQSRTSVSEQNTAAAQLYLSPVINFDKSGLFLLQFRDAQSGEVKVQVPPERVVREYQEHVLSQDVRAVGPAGGSDEDTGQAKDDPHTAENKADDQSSGQPAQHKVSVQA